MNEFNKIRSKIKTLSNDRILNENIIRKVKGSFLLYNVYKITNFNGEWEVIKHNSFIHRFTSSSNATSWCIADYRNKYIDAHNLIIIDHRLLTKKIEIKRRTRLLASDCLSVDARDISLARITEDLHTCRNIQVEINDNYVNQLNIDNLRITI